MTLLHLLKILDLLGFQKWWTGGQSYRLYPEVSELLQLLSYVQLKDMTGSGWVILGPRKLFLLVFCRDDHTTPFENFRSESFSIRTSCIMLASDCLRKTLLSTACCKSRDTMILRPAWQKGNRCVSSHNRAQSGVWQHMPIIISDNYSSSV